MTPPEIIRADGDRFFRKRKDAYNFPLLAILKILVTYHPCAKEQVKGGRSYTLYNFPLTIFAERGPREGVVNKLKIIHIAYCNSWFVDFSGHQCFLHNDTYFSFPPISFCSPSLTIVLLSFIIAFIVALAPQ